MNAKPDLGEQLRSEMKDSELSDYRLAHETAIPQPTLNRFRNGQSSLSLKHASTLAHYFGLELRQKRKPSRA